MNFKAHNGGEKNAREQNRGATYALRRVRKTSTESWERQGNRVILLGLKQTNLTELDVQFKYQFRDYDFGLPSLDVAGHFISSSLNYWLKRWIQLVHVGVFN